MSTLIELKQYIGNFISRFEVYLKPIGKLLLSLIALITINSRLGYMHKLDNISIVMIVALMCSFMPANFIVLISAVFIVLHMYALSLEYCIVILVLFIVLFLLYFRFSPKDTVVVVITPLLCMMGMPYVLPVAMGLIGGPYSAVSLACGLIVSFVLGAVSDNATALAALETEDMATRLKLIIDSMMDNKALISMIIAFAITVMVVFFVKRMSIDYAWTIAIVSGAVVDAVIVLVCDLAMDADISIVGILFGTILAVVVGFIIQFLLFNVDYNRTEKVQFEDDEYYYYVKAVPKVTVAAPAKTVKKINSSKKRPAARPSQRNTARITDLDDEE